ncbi:MAG TPA: DUF1501 domain-containing protein [Planctomycetota bacterium]|nr:DUF1501 domain-containing protein [Planctomycetota bacterium]
MGARDRAAARRAGRFGTLPPSAFAQFRARQPEGLAVIGRRSMLKASVAGLGGLSLASLLEARAAAHGERRAPSQRSVILLWMAGGPSHIDTWDVKPDAPREIRGPFGTIPTKLPGVRLCEYLPKQAALLDRLTIIRSVDARGSNHEPNQVFQTGNREAEPRTNPRGDKYPAIASIAARIRGAEDSSVPPYVVLNLHDRSHVAWGGYLGKAYDPFLGTKSAELFGLPDGLTPARVRTRRTLLEQVNHLRRGLDTSGSLDGFDEFGRAAVELVAGGRARVAFDLAREPEKVRERYGPHEWSQQALLARRLVEAGVSFVTIDLSNHSASGTWDTHGDNIPPYGGIWNGLRPLLPVFDHCFSTLITDLEQRGLLETTLVIAMGEFGRTPRLGTQGSTDGRDHWPEVLSMTLAGGGFRHGQVIGATDRHGAFIAERPVTPGDLAATIYTHLGVPLDATYLDFEGRPRSIVEDGSPIRELTG